jgi:hypothetical protein
LKGAKAFLRAKHGRTAKKADEGQHPLRLHRPEFRDHYARAREAQTEAMAEEVLEIADTPLEGERVEEGSNKDGAFEKTVREDMLGHRRLQIAMPVSGSWPA